MEVIIVRDLFKNHANKIIETIIRLKEKFHVERIVLGSDFIYYLGRNLDRIGTYTIDDRAIEVQVADVLANTYRRHRKIAKIAKFTIKVF